MFVIVVVVVVVSVFVVLLVFVVVLVFVRRWPIGIGGCVVLLRSLVRAAIVTACTNSFSCVRAASVRAYHIIYSTSSLS